MIVVPFFERVGCKTYVSWVSEPFAVTSALYKTDLERHSTFRGQLTVPLLQLQLDGDVDIDVGTRVDECTGLVEADDDVVFMCSSVLNILLLWLDIIWSIFGRQE